jgi:hypothetical protein
MPSRPSNPLALLLALLAAPAAAAPSFTPVVETRVRFEAFDAARVRPDQEGRYELGLARVRAGGELAWSERFRLRGLVQGAAMAGVPDDAAFGSAPLYSGSNGGDDAPEQVGLAELAAIWKGPRVEVVLGRQAFVDGAGPSAGGALVDAARQRRIADRLIGPLEFPNVGRRFDGVVVRADAGAAGRLELHALRALAGAFHYEDAFEQLDVDLAGASLASPFGGWIPAAQVRLFVLAYRDEREVARRSAGGELEIDTAGASLLAGGPAWDALLWGAVQSGDYGARDHSAEAVIAGLGRRLGGEGAPSLHLGFEQASGGGGEEHGAFFNLLPTNHKFYGALDYLAFSNLRDLFLELRAKPATSLSLVVALHDFRLVDRGDAWYGGSGAFSERELGFVSRVPAEGRYLDSELARELDLTLTWATRPELELKLESGWWEGGPAAEQFARAEADGAWVALEASWKPKLASRP